MNLVDRVKNFIIGYALAIFYGLFVTVLIIVNFLRHPFTNPWAQKLRLVPPAPLSDPKYGVHKYVKVNDVKLHYVESGDPSKKLIIFVHGFPEFWYSWRHQILEFQKTYWVVAVDMRGYGDSQKPEGVGAYNIDLLAADVRELLRHLGREKCILVGHDWGSSVASHFRLNYPEALDAVIISSAPSWTALSNLIITEPKQSKRSWYTFFYRLPWLPEMVLTANDMEIFDKIMAGNMKKGTFTNEDLECYKYCFGKPGAMTAPVNYYRAIGVRGCGLIENRKPISEENVPFLYLLGEKDANIHKQTLDQMKGEYKYIETTIVPDTAHFLQEEEPEKINKFIKDFLIKHNL